MIFCSSLNNDIKIKELIEQKFIVIHFSFGKTKKQNKTKSPINKCIFVFQAKRMRLKCMTTFFMYK